MVNRAAGTMDKYELARFLESLASSVRDGNYDVQSLYEGLEISSKELNGFRIHITGHINPIITDKPSINDQVIQLFHERNNRLQGPWIETIVDEAEYQVDRFFEDDTELVEEAWEKFYTAELLYKVAHRLWVSDSGIIDQEYVNDVASDVIADTLPAEAYENEN